ncbi:MAG TPA: dual specificity protein phosphatase family protein [Polyangiaceae bacterium]|jgi:protein-tyrosine phosphatase|nr:dual specificity protein phosphatase family protein [Polyangiaceae bacterium]
MSGAPDTSLDFTWILPNLAMGGARSIERAEHLARTHGIRHIVDLRLEEKDDEAILRHHGMTLLHLPTEDMCAIAIEMIDHGVTWVRRHLDAGDRVFIHCQWGIGRSALLTCCVLVSLGHSPGQALALAKKNRPIVSPSPEQIEALLAWSHHQARGGEPPHTDTWADLAAIAYNHPKRS